ncbi:protein phosphatase Slingshot homolog 2 isoform X2 [Ambystoma mexicanum]|uniref:protein phosphatase Slingshot homolog 2 isoform X2 n=1 Tax=Ambystoma mexicanum TaxID=8296 RepID=UPI0037E8D7CB
MTLGALSGRSLCACCGQKMIPYFSENAVISQNAINQLISESFLTVKGAALFLPRGNGSSTPRISHRRNKHAGDLQQHLQAMFTLLRPEDNIRLAVRLESSYQNRTRYMVVVSTNGRQDTEESLVLGMDFAFNDSTSCTMGLVLPLWSDTLIHLDGDGGFSVSTDNRVHIFKPVSVQAMWSALQSLHKACEVARSHNYYPGSLFLTWVSYYESRINSDQMFVNEWNAMQDVQSHRSDSPVLFTDVPTERERTERLIKTKLREIMMQKDLENITSKEIRTELEMQMVCNLREFKEFIDNEMIVILGQMDSPTEIFDHVFLGSEWNASNLEELQNRGVRYILNVTREIDNFFPGVFEYHNIRVYDEEATDLLAYWNDTYKFISKAKKHGSKCLVHCKMGVSRSASTVIAYAMKEYGWNLDRAFDYVKERRHVTKPNPSFMRQLEEYQGILLASKQRHNKLWRSHSDSDLSDHHEPIGKTGIEHSRKDITSSAEQLTDVRCSDINHTFTRQEAHSHDESIRVEVCTKDHTSLEIMGRSLDPGQLEDILNLNTINGCPAGGCLSDPQIYLDNCRPPPACEGQTLLEQVCPMDTELLELRVEDVEKDALKIEHECHLLPMEELTSRLKELPSSPEPISPDCNQGLAEQGTDRIDFFSALEKFVELSQDSRCRVSLHARMDDPSSGRNGTPRGTASEGNHSETAEIQRNGSQGSSPQTSEDSSTDEEQPKDVPELIAHTHLPRSVSENVISVKEIITEIESINQAVGHLPLKTEAVPCQALAPKRNLIHDLAAEASYALETNNNKLEGSEGISVVACEDVASLVKPVHVDLPDEHCLGEESEEGDPMEDQQDLAHQCPKSALKWCPGSVRRATLEFEERLRQEQEHLLASPICTLLTRKNSRNEETSPDPVPKEHGQERVKRRSTGSKTALPHPCGSSADAQSSMLLEPHTAQPKPDALLTTPSSTQEVSLLEHRTLVLLEDSDRQALPSHLPKRIEIIEYTHVVRPPDPKGIVLPVVENRCEQTTTDNCVHSMESNHDTSVPLNILPSSFSCEWEVPDIKQATFTVGSPLDEMCILGTIDGTQLRSPDPHYPFTDAGYHDMQHIVLEGVTEQCTSTDYDTEGVPIYANSPPVVADMLDSLHRESDGALTPLSSEDLNLISRLTENIRELREVLDVSSICYGLPHSSSSDSIKDLCSGPGVVKQRAREIEARIRQAGLTTPSQMKRSASLAKLGCLELSKDDLSERESVSSDTTQGYSDFFSSPLRIAPGRRKPASECCAEDPPEKLCIISLPDVTHLGPTCHFVEQLRVAECVVQSRPVEKPLVQYAKEFVVASQDPCVSVPSHLTSSEEHLPRLQVLDAFCPTPFVAPMPRQQHSRTHPIRKLRRTSDKRNERKRTTNPLYNTM